MYSKILNKFSILKRKLFFKNLYVFNATSETGMIASVTEIPVIILIKSMFKVPVFEFEVIS